jgi:PAS domain S-box-containing protein
MEEDWGKYRDKIIGLGELSAHKSFYPELQEKIDALEISQINLQSIIDSISDGIFIHNLKGKILLLNVAAQKIYNIRNEEKNSYTVMDLSSPEMDIKKLAPIWQKVLHGKTQIVEWVLCQAGTKKEIAVQVSVNKTIWENKPAIVAVVRDFSERKKFEEELIIARKKAEENDRLKSAFLANLSHEIRTPMNAILGFTDLLRDADLPSEKGNEYISIVHKSGNYLLSIINDIIEMSKLDTGQISIHPSWINLNTYLQNLYHTLKITIPKDREVQLEILPFEQNNIVIKTDEIKLTQILTNLITNSIKYTKEGSISFGYKLTDNHRIEFTVKDTGIGIEKKYHAIIFDRFTRAENDMSIIAGGSGLGLAITKAYVELLEGSITFESEINKGSTFSLSIPLIEYKP